MVQAFLMSCVLVDAYFVPTADSDGESYHRHMMPLYPSATERFDLRI